MDHPAPDCGFRPLRLKNSTIQFRSRGTLASTLRFEDRIEIVGRFQFKSSDDNFKVVFRSSLDSVNESGERNGIIVAFANDGNEVSIQESQENSMEILAATPVDLENEQDVEFRINDDGQIIALYIDDFQTPLLSANSAFRAGGHVAIYNRELSSSESELDFVFVANDSGGGIGQKFSASIRANSFSFSLGSTRINTADTVVFTTYDGLSETPLFDTFGSAVVVSGEFKPVPIGSTTYRSDYGVIDPDGNLNEFGTVTTQFPEVDTDGNGVVDSLQIENSTSLTISGTAVPDFSASGTGDSVFTVSLTRMPGASFGNYAGQFSNAVNSSSFEGIFGLLDVSGFAFYGMATSNTIEINLESRSLGLLLLDLSGLTTFRIDGLDQLTIDSFTLIDRPTGDEFGVFESVLTRNGDTYRGEFEIFDGLQNTSWRDFQNYVIEVTDPNDSDNDGIPNLTDPVPSQDDSDSILLSGSARLVNDRTLFQDNIYNGFELSGPRASFSSRPGEITRVSFIDPDGDLIFVEFGSDDENTLLTILLEDFQEPQPSPYTQPGTRYVEGLANITIDNPTPATFISIFSLGNDAARVDPSLINIQTLEIPVDGIADVKFLRINAPEGMQATIGGINAANADFTGRFGFVGIDALNTNVNLFLFIGDITPLDSALPRIIVNPDSPISEIRITGGDLREATEDKQIDTNGAVYFFDIIADEGQRSISNGFLRFDLGDGSIPAATDTFEENIDSYFVTDGQR